MEIALKVLAKDANENERKIFRNEFFTLKKLNHPGIIKAFEFSTILNCNPADFGVENGSAFFTLEYFPGATIGDIDFSNDPGLLTEIIKQICSTLFYLHLSDYIYFDLKTENILCRIEERTAKIKLIDMGFAAKRSEVNLQERRGSAEYIAPELLQNKPFDHRVDLYSLGILFYKLIFKKFPFSKLSEIEIYKAHIEENFTIEPIEIIPALSKVISRLLEKDSSNRYENSLHILGELNIPVDSLMAKDFHPASVFIGRSDIINIIRNFLSNKEISEIYSLHGFDGAGKSSTLSELEYLFENAIVIRAGIPKSGEQFLKFVLSKILYSPIVYLSIDESLKSELTKFIIEEKKMDTSELRTLFASVVKSTRLILLIDDYNQLDEFNLEFFREVIPLLQVNGAKIILTDNSGIDSKIKKLHNITEIDLSSFTSVQLHEFIERSFFSLFPKNELEKIILRYADLLPGSLINFISDLILLGVLNFSNIAISIHADEEVDKILSDSQSEIFKLRICALSDEELNFAQILSSFEMNLDVQSMQALTGMPDSDVKKILTKLFYQNIIQAYQSINYIAFTSPGIKKFVYEMIRNRNVFHGEIGKKIIEKLPNFNKLETARHFEIAGNIALVFSLYKSEIDNAELISAFSYQVKLLNKLSELPINAEQQFFVYSLLAEKNYSLRDFNSTVTCVEKIGNIVQDKKSILNLLIIKGSSLVESGNPLIGKQVLLNALDTSQNDLQKLRINLELANAEYELGNYNISFEICSKIIQNQESIEEIKAKAHNLLAFYFINFQQNLVEAMHHLVKSLEYYKKSNVLSRASNVLSNIGNVHNLMGNIKEAESAWNEALKINSSIGSLVQEANQMLNYGVYYHEKFDYEDALIKYNQAKNIFLSVGDYLGFSLIQLNLGELNMELCEFDKAYEILLNTANYFNKPGLEQESSETLFILGQLFILIGDTENFKLTLDEFKNLLLKNNLPQKAHANFKLLNLAVEIRPDKIDFIEIQNITNWYLENGETRNFIRSKKYIAELLLLTQNYDATSQELNEPNYLKACENNIFFNAERQYFLGKITKNLNAAEPAMALNHFESALGLLNDEKILELTWKILIEIALCYKELGQISKAINYSKYAYASLKYLLENITNQRIRNFYYQKKCVSNAFEITKSILQNGG